MKDHLNQTKFLEFIEEWLDLQKPLVPLMRLIVLQSLIDKESTHLLTTQLIIRLVQVSDCCSFDIFN